MGTIHTVTPPEILGKHLIELKQTRLMEGKTATSLNTTSRSTILHTPMQRIPQSSVSRFLQLLTTVKSNTTTPLIKSTPTTREHMPVNSGSTTTKPCLKTHSTLLLPMRISTINPRIMGITDRTVLSHSILFNNTSQLHPPPLAGPESPLPKRVSELMAADTEHKQRPRRHDER
jgi:hypothetical protein